MKNLITILTFLISASAAWAQTTKYTVTKTDAEWRKQLTAEQYQVARKKGTERAFTGKYHDNHEKGIYKCVCCGQELFTSSTKFESGTGWPSFWQPIKKKKCRRNYRQQLWHGTYRSKLQPMRRPFRTCV